MPTRVKPVNGANLVVRIEEVPASGVYNVRCSINTERGISFGSSPTETLAPWCDQPNEPGWVETEIDGLNSKIKGSGIANTPDIKFFFDWLTSGDAKNIQFAVNVPLADGGGYWQGAYKLTGFDLTGASQKGKSTFGCDLASHDEVTWIPA
jgi:hypothetical protein